MALMWGSSRCRRLLAFTAIVCSALAMLSMTWIHATQRTAFERTYVSLSALRFARIDLVEGFFLVLSSEDRLERSRGRALLNQAREIFEEAADEAALPVHIFSKKSAEIADIRLAFAHLLDALDGIPPSERPRAETSARLRIFFYDLERMSENLDLEIQGEMNAYIQKRDREYLGALWFATFVLLGICVAVHAGARAEAAVDRSLRENEKQLRMALDDKEVLLRELHHRTKNNMQVISSWLALQAGRSDCGDVREVLEEAQARIRAMALAHRLLYRSGELSRVDLGDYIRELVLLQIEGQAAGNAGIEAVFELEKFSVLVDVAVPCGLILSELVSNSLKHAFTGGGRGTVRVSLRRDGGIELTYSDDGKGVPAGFDFHHAPGLGLKTIFAIGQGQLRGRVMFACEQGLVCRLVFSDDIYQERV